VKRTAVLLLTAIYLLSSLGVAANSYYCCGKLQLTTILDGSKQQSDCKKMASMMPKCCKTKKQYFKVKDQHVGATAFSLDTKVYPAINIPYLTAQLSINIPDQEFVSFNSHAPPDRFQPPFYILNCTYRI
jgi:hypothetical protein